MSKIEELTRQLNDLPEGYISRKQIHGRYYYYLQRLQDGKVKSSYVREDDLGVLKDQLDSRKSIESEIRQLLSSCKNAPAISARARELTGSLMMADTEVARFEKGQLVRIDEKLAPLFITRTHNITEFLASRAIDASRANARAIKQLMGIGDESDHIVALYSHGATITDNYWFRAKGSKLKHADIAFENDIYSDVTLNGHGIMPAHRSKLTPELTLTGSYEKCWRLIDGKWWLYKKGSEDEIFSELFCSRLAAAIGLPSAVYEEDHGDIRTRNFANESNFESMTSIAGDDDSYDNVFTCLYSLDKDIATEYLKLIWFDTIVNNVDRHNENCGLMRDSASGEILSLAPNFDNNLALIARSRALNMDPAKDGLIKYFVKFVKGSPDALTLYRSLELPEITEDLIAGCFDGLDTSVYDTDIITAFILGRYRYLMELK